MQKKSWIKYILYIVAILGMITVWGYVDYLISVQFKHEFRMNYNYLVIHILLGILIGLSLGLEHFMKERSKEGLWKINLPRIIILGLPSLYLSLSYVLIYINHPFIQNIIAYPLLHFFRYSLGHADLFELLFGAIVMTSFYKKYEET